MLNETYIGQPVVLKGKVYGRIIELKGTTLGDTSLHSKVRISTPSCTIIETGIFFLDEATSDDMIKLKEFEQYHIDNPELFTEYEGKMYCGMLEI